MEYLDLAAKTMSTIYPAGAVSPVCMCSVIACCERYPAVTGYITHMYKYRHGMYCVL